MPTHKKHTPFRPIAVVCAVLASALILVGFALSKETVELRKPQPTTHIKHIDVPPLVPGLSMASVLSQNAKADPAAAPLYTDEDLDVLSRIMYAEAGCTWIPDDVQLKVGSVVLNRVNSSAFPDTIHEVVYQRGQYSPTWSGAIDNTPDERTVENARKLLEGGSVLPENVVFQANFTQGGGIYDSYYDETLGTTTYFCYGNEAH